MYTNGQFFEIIQSPSQTCHIKRILDSMNTAPLCLTLLLVNGHPKSALLLYSIGGVHCRGGRGGSVVTILCLRQCNASPSHSHWVDEIVDCHLWNVGQHLFNGCEKLLNTGKKWTTLPYVPMQSIPKLLHEYAGHLRTGKLSAFRNCVQLRATWSDGHDWMVQLRPPPPPQVPQYSQSARISVGSVRHACVRNEVTPDADWFSILKYLREIGIAFA